MNPGTYRCRAHAVYRCTMLTVKQNPYIGVGWRYICVLSGAKWFLFLKKLWFLHLESILWTAGIAYRFVGCRSYRIYVGFEYPALYRPIMIILRPVCGVGSTKKQYWNIFEALWGKKNQNTIELSADNAVPDVTKQTQHYSCLCFTSEV